MKGGRVTTLTSKNGLPCDAVHSMAEDNDHFLWLNMACGLVRVARPGLDAWIADAKNDPGDAYKLAELVYFKPRLLHPIQHRSREAQADLSWIRGREVLIGARTQLVNAVRGMSKAFGERLAKCSTEAFTARLAKTPVSTTPTKPPTMCTPTTSRESS